MGTNYYARRNICKCCRRYDEEHIGKSSAGWTFTFHATKQIRSYKQWLEYLSLEGVKIFNEYGKEISLIEFEDLVEGKKDYPLNHSKESKEGGSFLDEEGNSFSPYEFS